MAILVRDANTSQPIAGVNLFVNGNAVVNYGGKPWPYQAVLEFTAAGYQKVTVTLPAGANPPDHVDMLAVAPDARSFIVQTSAGESKSGAGDSPIAGGTVTLSQNGNQLESGGINPDGSYRTTGTYPGGTYQLAISHDGYAPLSQDLTVTTGQGTYPVTVQAASDPGTSNTPAATAASKTDQAQSPALVPDSTAPDPPEFLPVYEQWGCWYTGTQARIYIGAVFIDEAETIHYMLQGNRVPIYGYASRDYDRLGMGKALVQGQIEINFVSEGYLLTILQDYTNQLNAPSDQKTQLRSEMAGLITSSQKLQASSTPSTQAAIQPSLDANTARMNQIQKNLSSSDVDKVKASLQQSTSTSIKARTPHAVYSPVTFDIAIEYGTKKDGAPKRLIEGCQLISCEQVIERDGTIKECYGFIARRLS
jgi:hypothetical protein